MDVVYEYYTTHRTGESDVGSGSESLETNEERPYLE